MNVYFGWWECTSVGECVMMLVAILVGEAVLICDIGIALFAKELPCYIIESAAQRETQLADEGSLSEQKYGYVVCFCCKCKAGR